MKLHYIGDARINKKDVCIFRDEHGKFYVKVMGITTQERLNASEIVRYLLNARNKMKECWINVYMSPLGITYLGSKFSHKSIAEHRATFMTGSGKRKLLYRIHVRLK